MNLTKIIEQQSKEFDAFYFIALGEIIIKKGSGKIDKNDYFMAGQKANSQSSLVLIEEIKKMVNENTPRHFTREYRDTDLMRDKILKNLTTTPNNVAKGE